MKLSQILTNPMLEKEFLLRMRTLRSPAALLFYLLAFGVFGLGFLIMADMYDGRIDPDRSLELFYFLTYTQLALVSFMTPGLTAGVISSEREKQTLNILLTTQLSSTSIIISKLIASISFMLLIVIATLPIYSIVFLVGGVSPVQVIIAFLFFIFMMFVLASFGIMFSTLIKKTMVSVISSYGLLIYIYGFTAFVAFVIEMLTWGRSGTSHDIGYYILATNPVAALYSLLDSSVTMGPSGRFMNLQFWHIFIPLYSILAALALWLSIRYLRPRLRKQKRTENYVSLVDSQKSD